MRFCLRIYFLLKNNSWNWKIPASSKYLSIVFINSRRLFAYFLPDKDMNIGNKKTQLNEQSSFYFFSNSLK